MSLDSLKQLIPIKSPVKSFLVYLFVFLFFFAIFYYLQFSFPYLMDADPWYHIKQAWLIRTQGLDFSVRNFPWLQHTIFREHPGDPWFGYHILLLPFTFGNLIFGAKLSAVFFASLFFLGFFLVLKRLQIKYPLFWTFILFFAAHSSFSFRLLLARPYLISILFSLFGAYLISQKKYIELFLSSILWSFTSIEAPLIGVMGVLWVGIEYWRERKIDWKILILPFLGIFLGLLIRPDFPNNLYLLISGTFGVMALRILGLKLSFGLELATPLIASCQFLEISGFIIFLTLFLVGYISYNLIDKRMKKIPTFHLFLFILSSLFFIVTTFKSIRFMEYWAPFTVLATAVISNSVILPGIPKLFCYFKSFQNYNLPPLPQYLEIYQRVYKTIRTGILFLERKSVKLLLRVFFLLFLFYFLILEIISLWRFYPNSAHLEILKEAAFWLKENTPPGSIVMNEPWHTFAYLFFYNHQNYYGYGMDPSFMYFKDKKLYWFWKHILRDVIICDKEVCEKKEKTDAESIYHILKDKLKADYLLLELSQICLFKKEKKELEKKICLEEFRDTLQESKYFEKVFGKEVIEIYKIK